LNCPFPVPVLPHAVRNVPQGKLGNVVEVVVVEFVVVVDEDVDEVVGEEVVVEDDVGGGLVVVAGEDVVVEVVGREVVVEDVVVGELVVEVVGGTEVVVEELVDDELVVEDVVVGELVVEVVVGDAVVIRVVVELAVGRVEVVVLVSKHTPLTSGLSCLHNFTNPRQAFRRAAFIFRQAFFSAFVPVQSLFFGTSSRQSAMSRLQSLRQ